MYWSCTYVFDFVLHFSCSTGCVEWWLCCRMWVWNSLPLNTYISLYARTNRFYKERGSISNYFLICFMYAYIYSTCVLEGPTDKMSLLAYIPPSDRYEWFYEVTTLSGWVYVVWTLWRCWTSVKFPSKFHHSATSV